MRFWRRLCGGGGRTSAGDLFFGTFLYIFVALFIGIAIFAITDERFPNISLFFSVSFSADGVRRFGIFRQHIHHIHDNYPLGGITSFCLRHGAPAVILSFSYGKPGFRRSISPILTVRLFVGQLQPCRNEVSAARRGHARPVRPEDGSVPFRLLITAGLTRDPNTTRAWPKSENHFKRRLRF